jgi:hypothetical protein
VEDERCKTIQKCLLLIREIEEEAPLTMPNSIENSKLAKSS